jgi:hypothetical protein
MAPNRSTLIAYVVAVSFAVASCAASPTPIADAMIPDVEVKIEGADTRDACRAIADAMNRPATTGDEVLGYLAEAQGAIDKAAASEVTGRDLAAAMGEFYGAIAVQDRAGMEAAFEKVFDACGAAGLEAGWDE